ncbi:Short-chain dehydrogenase/reductase SDR [Macrophomina phaseolina MS6]|uniref:Short-chain dehydrogenase/reductase SDR n=1 Tax=Macrophomina phaseolina (strain MS6) TaxID=1126212 RepID=K2S7N0_MACPH|nr:Short-chain dehydrogenase/reductase SDR [Macrophomina phaseolina MS6]
MSEIEINDHDFQSLKDKVILITGGSSGIGLKTAFLAEQQGAKVVVGDINPLTADVEGRNIVYVPLDVTSWPSQSEYFRKAYELHGRIDHVFANAAVAPDENFLDEKFDEDGQLKQPNYRTMDVGQKGVIDTVFLALHYMKKQPTGGSIVITSSVAGIVSFPVPDYSVAKHAVFGLMRSIDYNMARTYPKIRCNAVAPSWTESGLVPPALAELGAVVQPPEAVARVVALLMADGARRGQTVYIHDGKAAEVGAALYDAVVKNCPAVPGPECIGVFDKMKSWVAFEEEQRRKGEQTKERVDEQQEGVRTG